MAHGVLLVVFAIWVAIAGGEDHPHGLFTRQQIYILAVVVMTISAAIATLFVWFTVLLIRTYKWMKMNVVNGGMNEKEQNTNGKEVEEAKPLFIKK